MKLKTGQNYFNPNYAGLDPESNVLQNQAYIGDGQTMTKKLTSKKAIGLAPSTREAKQNDIERQLLA